MTHAAINDSFVALANRRAANKRDEDRDLAKLGVEFLGVQS